MSSSTIPPATTTPSAAPARSPARTNLTKSGPGRLTLGAHSFTGKTTVNQGELRLAGNLTSSPVTVQGLGRLSGSGSIGGLVTTKRASVSPGTVPGNIANLAVTGATAFSGTKLEFDLPVSGNQAHDSISITGNLALSGINPIVFRVASGNPTPGTYPIITFTGTLTGGLANLQYDPAFTTLQTQLVIGAGVINLIVSPPPSADILVWRGTGSVWDSVSENWLVEGLPTIFADTDLVTFGPGGAAAPVVTIEGNVQPESVTVDSSSNYTFNGPGTIGGAAVLQKSNSGNLTLSGANSYTGGTLITGGTLLIGNAAALGTGTRHPRRRHLGDGCAHPDQSHHRRRGFHHHRRQQWRCAWNEGGQRKPHLDPHRHQRL